MKSFKINIAIIASLFSFQLFGQYNWYSQYEYNLVNNNPAIIANDNFYKLVCSFKNNTIVSGYQDKLAYFSAEVPFKLSKTHDHIGGVGLTLTDDNYAVDNLYRRTGITLTHGQSIKITSKSYLSAGLSIEYYQRKTNTDGFTSGSQWVDNQGYDASLGLGESNIYDQINLFNFSGGVYWRLVDARKLPKAHAGIAVYNINQPNESFLDSDNKIPMRFTLSGSYRVFEKNSIKLTPDVLINSQGSEQFYTLGGLVNYSFKNTNPFSLIKSGSLDFGIRYTYDYSTAFIFRLNQKNTIAGVNIDLGTSKSSKYGFKGNTFEVLLVLRKEAFKHNQDHSESSEIDDDDDDDYQIGETRGFIKQNPVLQQSQIVIVKCDSTEEGNPPEPAKVKLSKDFKFGFNNAELDEDASEYLDELITLLNYNKNLKLEIIGHTDNIGSKEANQKLSEKRARVVYDYLVSEGINKKRIQYKGKADTEPIAPNDTAENRAKNRRVEFILYTE